MIDVIMKDSFSHFRIIDFIIIIIILQQGPIHPHGLTFLVPPPPQAVGVGGTLDPKQYLDLCMHGYNLSYRLSYLFARQPRKKKRKFDVK